MAWRRKIKPATTSIATAGGLFFGGAAAAAAPRRSRRAWLVDNRLQCVVACVVPFRPPKLKTAGGY